MTLAPVELDNLGMLDCRIASVEIDENLCEVRLNIIDGLDLFPPHPMAESWKSQEPCQLVFRGVSHFVIKKSPYRCEAGKLTVDAAEIETCDFHSEAAGVRTLGAEGVLVDGNGTALAWLDLTIHARELLLRGT